MDLHFSSDDNWINAVKMFCIMGFVIIFISLPAFVIWCAPNLCKQAVELVCMYLAWLKSLYIRENTLPLAQQIVLPEMHEVEEVLAVGFRIV